MANQTDRSKIVFKPSTFERHERALGPVAGRVRTRNPRKGRGRFPGVASGAFGLLADGETISGCSGIVLGTGTVRLCDRDGVAHSPEMPVDVKNAGSEISASGGDRILAMEWTAGDWTVCGCDGVACGCDPLCDGQGLDPVGEIETSLGTSVLRIRRSVEGYTAGDANYFEGGYYPSEPDEEQTFESVGYLSVDGDPPCVERDDTITVSFSWECVGGAIKVQMYRSGEPGYVEDGEFDLCGGGTEANDSAWLKPGNWEGFGTEGRYQGELLMTQYGAAQEVTDIVCGDGMLTGVVAFAPQASEFPVPIADHPTSATVRIPLKPALPQVCCYPCPLPKLDLPLTWDFAGNPLAGMADTGEIGLAYGSAGEYPWLSESIESTEEGESFRWAMKCSIEGYSKVYLLHYTGATLTSSTLAYDEANTCYPFHLEMQLGGDHLRVVYVDEPA